ncbi:mitochondrial 2-oxoglutarate/malate carrier protein-like [Belonocnema kinseyi]|uniref:mitochondrial 2-oxoglutarate/malate carrier protein-like n=1 Tax=Belonocnema kinseyi TaxID=2817044 RepID=UPI00143DC954|nr:mitochondrial 2-oxoglutarate/malate carrier protein-like [Belonocnema kinseyi]
MSDQSNDAKPKTIPPVINFLNAGLAGMCGVCCVHPTDVVKNRMQISTHRVTIRQTFLHILKNERIINFYDGLSASLVRQATYTTTRLGIYNQLQDIWREKYTSKPSFLALSGMAAFAGGSGAFVGNPADLALVRMSTDGRLPPDQRRNYKNVIDAFIRVSKEEGITNLWRGSVATIGRAVVVNISQLATYSQTKYMLQSSFNVPEGVFLQFYSAMVSGLITSINSMPFDIAKTSDLDTTCDVAEVTEAVMQHFGEVDVGHIKVNLTKRAFRGNLKAYIKLREELAERLARTGHLKVGWMSCRVRKKTVTMRCFRCHGFGHVAARCEGPHRTKMCWTCGSEGHKSAECVSTPQCFLCAAHSAKPRTDHRPGTMRCTSFREATLTRKPPGGRH